MSFKSKASTVWNWTKSCFNSTAWYEAAEDHAQKAAPLIENIANNPKTAIVGGALLLGVDLYFNTTGGAMLYTHDMASRYTLDPIRKWGNSKCKHPLYQLRTGAVGSGPDQGHIHDYIQQKEKNDDIIFVHRNLQNKTLTFYENAQFKWDFERGQPVSTKQNVPDIYEAPLDHITTNLFREIEAGKIGTKITDLDRLEELKTACKQQKDTKTWKAANAIGHVAVKGATIAGGLVVLAGLYAASNAATNIGKAIVWDRSESAIKEAASKSLQEANAIRHVLQGAGDYVVAGVLNVTLDPAKWLVKGAWNHTVGRLFHHDEQTIDMAGDIIDASGSEA